MRNTIEREKSYTAQFDRFEIEMSGNAALDCSHSGDCAEDVEFHAPTIKRDMERCSPERLARELKEYGAWDEAELEDDERNWHRIVWIAAGNICEENREESEV